MKWINLTNSEQLAELDNSSFVNPSIIFKHSYRCFTSVLAKRRFEETLKKFTNSYSIYLLDVVSHRQISNIIAEKYNITHESPQVLVIQNSRCIYHKSHEQIDGHKLKEYAVNS